MESVVNQLNEILTREHGEVEAVDELLHELKAVDADIAESARDVLRTASWSCQGLYHRISQLGGTATLDSSNLAGKLADRESPQAKVRLLCREQHHDEVAIRRLLKNEDLDSATRSFLQDLLRAHEDSQRWCESVLGEWKPDI